MSLYEKADFILGTETGIGQTRYADNIFIRNFPPCHLVKIQMSGKAAQCLHFAKTMPFIFAVFTENNAEERKYRKELCAAARY